jgi:hypothetical protein
MTSDILEELKKSCAGLEYPSESDAPFEVFQWTPTKNDSAQNQVATHAGANRKIIEVPVDQFFGDLNDSEDAPRFAQLRRSLEKNLAGLKVFRAGDGEVKVDIYLIGKTAAGDWAGLLTTSVET